MAESAVGPAWYELTVEERVELLQQDLALVESRIEQVPPEHRRVVYRPTDDDAVAETQLALEVERDARDEALSDDRR